jgi:prevent-host-death family protein
MQTLTAQEAKSRFGEFIDRSRREPVRVTRGGHVVGVMVSPEDYEAMRVFFAHRLLDNLDRAGEMAGQRGLTEDELTRLLADDS